MDSSTFWKIIVQGFIFIIIGILILRYTYYQPKSISFSVKFKSYVGGVTFILIGIIHLLNKFHFW